MLRWRSRRRGLTVLPGLPELPGAGYGDVDFWGVVEVLDMFVKGKSGNPAGRPKGSLGGRARAIIELDRILGRNENAKLLADELEKEFQADPVRFFKNVVMPLLPKESRVDVAGGIVRWQSLIEAGPSPAPEPADWQERLRMFRESGGEIAQ